MKTIPDSRPNKRQPSTKKKSIRRAPALLLAALILSAGTTGCLRFQESDFDSTGTGLLWPLLFSGNGIFTLGQLNTTSVQGITLGMQRPRHMAIVGGKLLISDQKNRRVLIWNSVPTAFLTAPDIALGTPDASTGGIDAYEYPTDNVHINDPAGIASDGTRLFIVDKNSHRVMVWNTFPTTNFQPADLVLGQANFTTKGLQPTAANTMSSPEGVAICGNRLFVTDSQNHRILAWNTLPTTTQASADYVLGQPNFTGNTPGTVGASSLNTPIDIQCTATQLFVADQANNRVLGWSTIPTTTSAPANFAVGQPDLTSSAPSVAANRLTSPQFVFASSNDKLYVSDTGSQRLLIYDPLPAADNASATVVLGQDNFSNNLQNNTSPATGLNGPADVLIHSGNIYLLDGSNNRMAIWSSELPATFANINSVLGQPDFTSIDQNNAGISASIFSQIIDISGDDTHLYITSDENHRTVGYTSMPTSTSPANIVLGQPDFSGRTANNPFIGADTLAMATGICVSGTRLYVSDGDNNRVLIWNTLPTSSTQPADLVLGQPDFTSMASGITQATFSTPYGIDCDAQRLVLADNSNNRVLIWNSPPTMNNQLPDLVLGQTDFTSNAGAPGAANLEAPRDVMLADGKLFVADSANHRVLIWNSIPTTNGQAADVVIGQSDFASNAPNGGSLTPTATGMTQPAGLEIVKGSLVVSELFNNRLLIFESVPTSNGATATSVFGQPDFTQNLPNNGGISGERFNVPFGMHYVASTERLFVVDVFNYRVLSIPVSLLGL